MGRLSGIIFLAVISLLLIIPCRAATTDESVPDANTLAQMEAHAQQATPREQCFLYTQLVNKLTELAGHQMLTGNSDAAATTLHQVQHYAQLIHLSLTNNTKRVMNAQMLLHNTTRKLGEYTRKASFEDRDTMEATLKQLNQVDDELLNQVFNH